MNSKERGDRGERIACAFLEQNGIRVIERNVRAGKGEIDIVAMDGEVVVIAEVKTRALPGVRPAEAMTPRKIRNLSRAALVYLSGKNWLERPIRFDVLEVTDEGASVQVNHIKDAFMYSGSIHATRS